LNRIQDEWENRLQLAALVGYKFKEIFAFFYVGNKNNNQVTEINIV